MTNGYPVEGAKIPKIQEEFLLAKFCLPGGKRFPDKLTNFIKQPSSPADQSKMLVIKHPWIISSILGPHHLQNSHFVVYFLIDFGFVCMETGTQKSYLGQCRKELFTRLFKILYPDGKTPNRLWFGFYRRKFLNMALPVSGAAS